MSASMQGPEIRRPTEGVVERATDGAERVRQGASEEVRRLVADVEDLIKKVAHITDADIARVRDKVQTTLVSARQSVEQNAVRLRDGSRELVRATDGYVHERPWTALGIAAAVGVLLGAITVRRR